MEVAEPTPVFGDTQVTRTAPRDDYRGRAPTMDTATGRPQAPPTGQGALINTSGPVAGHDPVLDPEPVIMQKRHPATRSRPDGPLRNRQRPTARRPVPARASTRRIRRARAWARHPACSPTRATP